MWITRPVLVALNALANRCLRLVGVEPVDEVHGGRNPADLRELVDHSVAAGTLDPQRRDQIITALDVDVTPVRAVVRPLAEISGVTADATVDHIRDVARRSTHLRLIVTSEDTDERPTGVVHVRDTLGKPGDTTAADLIRPILTLDAAVPVHTALRAMRDNRTHIALVNEGSTVLGLVTLHDLLDQLLPS